MRSPLQVGLVGWNGRRNVGDDAMTSVLVHESARIADGPVDCRILADARTLPHIEGAGDRLRVRGYPGFNAVMRLPVGRLRLLARRLLYEPHFTEGLDLLIFGGGSILHTAREIGRFRRLVSRVKSRSAVVGAMGVSIGPFRTDAAREECRRFLNELDFIGVRDADSAACLRELDTTASHRYGLDIAVLLPDYVDVLVTPSEAGRRLGVSVRRGVMSLAEEAALAMAVRGLLQQDTDLSVAFFVFCDDHEDGDAQLVSRLMAQIGLEDRVHTVPYAADPAEFYRQTAACTAMIAMRLHAAVLAYSVGTPFVMLSYHPKCAGFANAVGLGSEFRFDTDVAGMENAAAAARELLSRSTDQHLLNVTAAREQARQGLHLMAEAVKSAASSRAC